MSDNTAVANKIDAARGAATNKAKDLQSGYFRITDDVPEAVWYWAALISILSSASLWIAGERDWSTFVGQWPPTFLLFGLFHKLLRLGRSNSRA